MTKKCIKCDIKRKLEKFCKDRMCKDGYRNVCKLCHNFYKRKKYDPEKAHQKYVSNSENIKPLARENYRRNRKSRLAQTKEYFKQNRDKIIEYHKNYYLKNKENVKNKNQVYRDKNRDRVREWNRNYNKRKRDIRKGIGEKYTTADEKITRGVFNNRCFRCGCTDNIHIDHHYPVSKGYPLSLSNAVLLCKDCNLSKFIKLPEEFYTNEEIKKVSSMLKSAVRIGVKNDRSCNS